MGLINTMEWILFLYFGFATWYLFFFSAAGIWGNDKSKREKPSDRKYAVLIPGYKEDAVIREVAQNAVEQIFPQEQFEVVVIADSFKPQTLLDLGQLPITLIEVEFEQSTKAKALNKAMEVLGDDYDVALILDADNIMEHHFISKIDQAFSSGFSVVQGHRVAKNLNTPIAILDAISEEINNHIFRRGHRVVGLSSALIGSGMAFDYKMFKSRMKNINAVGGFDKELELTLLRDQVKIEYVNDALILDEKVQKKEVFKKQRTRWLSAQFVYFRRFFVPGVKHLIKDRNIDFFDKVYQMISPPRIIHLGTVLSLTLIYGFINLVNLEEYFSFSTGNYFGLLCLTILAFAVAIPRKLFAKINPKILMEVPKLFFIMFLSLFKLKGANKTFIHTVHGTDEENNSNNSKTKIQ